jgi:hypothetical protein
MERVTDPHHSNADPDTAFHLNADPALHFNADPYPHQFADEKPKCMECEPISAPFQGFEPFIIKLGSGYASK